MMILAHGSKIMYYRQKMDHVQRAILTRFSSQVIHGLVMSHFKFVSTINAAEEGCTHFLVLGNKKVEVGTHRV